MILFTSLGLFCYDSGTTAHTAADGIAIHGNILPPKGKTFVGDIWTT